MKVKECPSRKHCFDYKDNNCDNCDFGNEFTKLHKRIDRLKKQNETLTIQRNAWYLTAERVGEDLQKAKAEVVRCKDCKFWTPMDNGISWHHQGRTDGECGKLWQLHCAERHLTNQDHFCSYGERKE